MGFSKFDFEKIKPLTIIEIDTLILFVSQLKEGKLNIIDLIDNYQQYVDYGRINFKSIEEIETHAYQSAIPFSEFVRDYSNNLGIEFDMRQLSNLLSDYGIR